MAIGSTHTDTLSAMHQPQAVSALKQELAFGKSVVKKQAKHNLHKRKENTHQTMDIHHQAVSSRKLFVLKDSDQQWIPKPLQLVKTGNRNNPEGQKKIEDTYKKMQEQVSKIYELDLCIQGDQVKVKTLIGGGHLHSILDLDGKTAKEFISHINQLHLDFREVMKSYVAKEHLEIVTLDGFRETYKRLGKNYAASYSKYIQKIGEYLSELDDLSNQFLELIKKVKLDSKMGLRLWREGSSDSEDLMKQKCIDVSTTLATILKNYYYYFAITAPIYELTLDRVSSAEGHSCSNSTAIYFKSVAMLVKYTGQVTTFYQRCGGKWLWQCLKETFEKIVGPQEKNSLLYYGCFMHSRCRSNSDDKAAEFYTDEYIKKSTQESTWKALKLSPDESFRISAIRINMAEYLTCSLCFLLGDKPILALNTIGELKEYFQKLLTDISEEQKSKLIRNVQCYVEFDLFFSLCQIFLFKLADYRCGEGAYPDVDIKVYSAMVLELDQFTKLFSYQSPNVQIQLQEVGEESVISTTSPLFSDTEHKEGPACWSFYESLVCLENVVEEIKWLSIIDSLRDCQSMLDHCHRIEFADTAFHQLIEEAEAEKKEAERKQRKKTETNKSLAAERALSHYSRKHEGSVTNTPKRPAKTSGTASLSSSNTTKESEFHPSLITALSEFGKKPFPEVRKHLKLVELDGTVCSVAAAKYATVDLLLIEAVKEIERLECENTGIKLDRYQEALDDDSVPLCQDQILAGCMARINTTRTVLKNSIGSIDNELEAYREYIQKHAADLQADFSCLGYFQEKLRVIKDGLCDIEDLSSVCIQLYRQRGQYIRRWVDSPYLEPHRPSSIGRQMERVVKDIESNSQIITECESKVDCLQACLERMVADKRRVFVDHQRKLDPIIHKAVNQIGRKEKREDRLLLSTAVDKLRSNFTMLVDDHSLSGCFLPVDLVDALSNFGKQCRQEGLHPTLAYLENPWAVESLFNEYVSQFLAQGKGRHQTLPNCYAQACWLERYNKKALFIPPTALMEASEGAKSKWLGVESDHYDMDMKVLSDALDTPVRIKFPFSDERQYWPGFKVVTVQVSPGEHSGICLGYDEGQICSVKLSRQSLQKGSPSDQKSDESASQTVPDLSKVETVTEHPGDSTGATHSTLEVLTIKQLEEIN